MKKKIMLTIVMIMMIIRLRTKIIRMIIIIMIITLRSKIIMMIIIRIQKYRHWVDKQTDRQTDRH